jgi:hypothetical protein
MDMRLEEHDIVRLFNYARKAMANDPAAERLYKRLTAWSTKHYVVQYNRYDHSPYCVDVYEMDNHLARMPVDTDADVDIAIKHLEKFFGSLENGEILK